MTIMTTPKTDTTADEQAVRDLHRRWILEGWERAEGDPPFAFRDKLGHFYDWQGDGVVLYDTMAPEHRVAHGPAEYAALFEPLFNRMRSALHAVVDGPDVWVGGDLAASTLEFTARLEPADGGPVMGVLARSSLAWRHTADGWRIVHEHNSTREVPVAQVEALLARA